MDDDRGLRQFVSVLVFVCAGGVLGGGGGVLVTRRFSNELK
jgi:hypothetical protein